MYKEREVVNVQCNLPAFRRVFVVDVWSACRRVSAEGLDPRSKTGTHSAPAGGHLTRSLHRPPTLQQWRYWSVYIFLCGGRSLSLKSSSGLSFLSIMMSVCPASNGEQSTARVERRCLKQLQQHTGIAGWRICHNATVGKRVCDCIWVSFDLRERTICGFATVAVGRGAAINVSAQPLNKQQV